MTAQVVMKPPLSERQLMSTENAETFPKRTKHLVFENITSVTLYSIKQIPVALWYRGRLQEFMFLVKAQKGSENPLVRF